MSKQALARRQLAFSPAVVQQLATLEQQLGGRQELVGLLVLAPLTPDLEYILGQLGDPRHQTKTLATICAEGNILPGALLHQLEAAAMLRGKVLSAQIVGRALPAVVADVMKKAAPYEGACHDCTGTGTHTPEPTTQVPNPIPQPCETCMGTGRLEYQPKLEHQELALEMGRMLPKGGGILIQNTQNNQGGGTGSLGGGSLEQLQRLTDKLLYEGDATEGEILPEDADADSV